MSVEIKGGGNSPYMVEINHKGEKLQLQCKDEKEAQKVAEEAKILEANLDKMEAERAKQGVNPDMNKSTPPKGVGEKLDVSTADVKAA